MLVSANVKEDVTQTTHTIHCNLCCSN